MFTTTISRLILKELFPKIFNNSIWSIQFIIVFNSFHLIFSIEKFDSVDFAFGCGAVNAVVEATPVYLISLHGG